MRRIKKVIGNGERVAAMLALLLRGRLRHSNYTVMGVGRVPCPELENEDMKFEFKIKIKGNLI